MLDIAALLKIEEGWKFVNEKILEDFVWQNLVHLFKLNPLKRQYSVLGELCDILAIEPNTNQLVIVELKNNEDRYVVQQLNRYYENLINGKPFSEQIDYSQPVRLISVAPSFQRHNFIDQKYNTT
ncbi:MAG TPA: endonuclease NucS domain-containing protein [Candidatus Obscuribacterales bacterium]